MPHTPEGLGLFKVTKQSMEGTVNCTCNLAAQTILFYILKINYMAAIVTNRPNNLPFIIELCYVKYNYFLAMFDTTYFFLFKQCTYIMHLLQKTKTKNNF